VDTELQEKTEIKTAPMKLFDVIFFNDDYTPMDFVVKLLTEVFKHSVESAVDVMMRVHNEGSSVVGTYFYEIADEKREVCVFNARQRGFPLQVEVRESDKEA
jgi:ATP-dependent Clp protease adaptor protein ClpS